MEIRPARSEEFLPLTQLYVRARNDMDYLPRVPDEDVERIAEMIRKHDEVWVAADEGRLLGFLAIEHSTNLEAPVLERLYVQPSDQSRGVGSALLDQAKALRPQQIYLWVFQKNTGAIRFYERHGFHLVKLTDGAENMEREPDALYEWQR
jgi:ribosomal protein S18 acetylase RimI-like enzyme